jgi:hypothetical protein
LHEIDGISASQIGRILADLDLKPHRTRGWLTRRDDPAFFAKAAEVCNMYLSIIAPLDVHTGQVHTERIGRNDSATFIALLTASTSASTRR